MIVAAGLAGLTRAALLAAAHPVRPGPQGGTAVSRRTGQQLARAELAKPIYQPSVAWTVRLGHWLVRTLNATGQAVPGGWWALTALVALLVIAVAAALAGIGPVARSRPRTRRPILSGARLSARDHRQNAERLAAAGITQVAGPAELASARAALGRVHVSPEITGYIVDLCRATRQSPSLLLGVSPRGATALLATARAWAWLSGRDYVTPDDVKALARPTFRHRVQLRPEAELEGTTPDGILEAVLASVPVPR